jgi:hypothetical protein
VAGGGEGALAKYDECRALALRHDGAMRVCPGVVTREHGDGTIDVAYRNGEVQSGVAVWRAVRSDPRA